MLLYLPHYSASGVSHTRIPVGKRKAFEFKMTHNRIPGGPMEIKSAKPAIEKPFFQSSWQNIPFADLGVSLSLWKLANSEFYSKFYLRLFQKYSRYDDLPKDWLSAKKATAAVLSKHIPAGAHVLSYGCGLGFMEKTLHEARQDLSLVAFDFSTEASKWLKECHGIQFINEIRPNEVFDVIYLCQVIYALPQADVVEILHALSDKLKEGGRLILINTSIDPSENSIHNTTAQLPSPCMDLLKKFKRVVSNFINRSSRSQFWGWERNNRSVQILGESAGFHLQSCFAAANQSYMIFSKEK